MKYTKDYDRYYPTLLIGYEFDGGYIMKDIHTSRNGHDVVDGWEVQVDKFGSRLFYAQTLKECKEWVEKRERIMGR